MLNLEAKLLFVGLYFTVATMEPFIALFLQDKQFDTIQIGIVFSISRVFGIVTTPFLGTIADHFKCHRLLLLLLVFLATATMTALNFIADGDVIWTSLALGVYMSAFAAMAVLNDTIVMEILSRQEDEKRKELEKQRRAAAINTVVRIDGEETKAGASMAVSEDEPEHAEEGHGAGAEYPSQRVWGSISFGVVAFLGGVLIEQYGKRANGGAGTSRPYLLLPALQCFSYILYGAIVFASYVREELYRHRMKLERRVAPRNNANSNSNNAEGVAAQREVSAEGNINTDGGDGDQYDAETETEGEGEESGLALPPPLHTLERLRGASIISLGAMTVKPTSRHSKRSIGTQLCDLIRFNCSGRVLGPVVGGMAILFLSDVVTMTFVFPYARRELHGTPILFSAATGAQLISEVILFFACSWLVKKIGPMWMLIISGISYGTKMMAYSLMPQAWFLIPIGLIHGLCFAVMWSAIVAHVTKFAKEYGKKLDAEGSISRGETHHDHHEEERGNEEGKNGEQSALIKKEKEEQDGDHHHHNHHTSSSANGSFARRSRASSRIDAEGGGGGENFVPKALNVIFFWVGIAAVTGGLLPIMMGNTTEGDASLELMLFRGCAIACWIVAVATRIYGCFGLID